MRKHFACEAFGLRIEHEKLIVALADRPPIYRWLDADTETSRQKRQEPGSHG
jgi:hypothetical protein